VSVCVGGGGGAEVSVLSPLSFFLLSSFFGFWSVDIVSVVCVCVVGAVVSVVSLAAVSLLVVVDGCVGRDERRSVVRGGGGCVLVATGAGCVDGTRAVVEPRGIGAAGALAIGGGMLVVVIAPGCCGGSTPVAGPPGMFAGGAAVPRVKLPVVSVFVAVVAGGRTSSPGAPTVVVALLVCPS